MAEIKVPEFGDSIQEVQVFQWLKKPGEWVERDEDIVELESEKASQALPAPVSGVLQSVSVAEGEIAQVGDLLCVIDESASKDGAAAGQSSAAAAAGGSTESTAVVDAPPADGESASWIMPAAQVMLSEYKISADAIQPSGPGGRLLKEDVLKYVEANGLRPGGSPPAEAKPQTSAPAPALPPLTTTPASAPPAPAPPSAPAQSLSAQTEEWNDSMGPREDTSKPMSMIRRTIAKRLVEAQQTAALLTTFNEVDMKPVMDLRSKYKEAFQKKHGVKLGFMSFFAKAVVEGLRRFPAINSEIQGNNIISKNYHDIGIAIGGGKGLVVPVLRNAERMSFADIERQIGTYAGLAADNKIKPADIEGGTFTISNGGVYGSLLSTPIVNPPQSGILGLHSIQDRAVVVNKEIVIRPMMYIALTYDHRIVDGKEAVTFLRTIKEVLEEPARLFLEV
ncbi:2-oxoglutarate dehydrogenase complex dihydrolipoyllysine-residue succinyltransferase [Mariniblastus fucicola]|uniref:Dihydrolipoyllysine-residue succinyltransferase component of 2-oxoglutarate dehydrogenase complex n=1 Tax=Mariniblastus fucicola TaxID=980251 RepID=A0A5B9PA08_9BACT|nr:2-oxoglutarate dehydrogenase complex dihydrolipoyllysine-residue succinyltransferase [Mariniblastus fucicola]QEG21782.1 Dihydrolipoyllysine-residue succinyltransferase component of 2-oxoglutarate dehydrogenase complex [Mariniblastus fucicola]